MVPAACPWEGTEHPPERTGCPYVTRGCFEIQSNKGAKLRLHNSPDASAMFFT